MSESSSIEPILSERQAEVLRHLSDHLTIKEIAGKLDVSESAINQRIRASKHKLNVSNHRDLIHAYRRLNDGAVHQDTCSFSAFRISQLPESSDLDDHETGTASEPVVSFGDSFAGFRPAPWDYNLEPELVPRVLNGANASLVRGAVIVAICLGTFAAILVALGVAQGLTDALAAWGR